MGEIGDLLKEGTGREDEGRKSKGRKMLHLIMLITTIKKIKGEEK